MTIEIRVPQLPESVADATIVSWHKKPGDIVARDENLVDLETDKVVLEVPAPTGGVLKEILLKDGTTVTSGQVLAVIDEGATAVPGASAPAIMSVSGGATTSATQAAAAAKDGGTAATAGARPDAASAKLSPAAKRVVEENKVDPKAVAGSGRDGRVEVGRSELLVGKRCGARARGQRARGAGFRRPSRSPRGTASAHDSSARANCRTRMVQAQATQALLTSFNEVDLKAVNELRARYKDQFEKQHGVKLGFMSFFAKACVEALKKFPSVNASVDGNDIVYHEYFDIGVAVSTERGLIVPVLRDADSLSFGGIEKSIGNFAARARAGTITMEELTGGTFTITNGGVFGSLLSTPIVNSPQSAILGMHKIQDRAVVIDGQVVVRPMMYVALTYDHRIIDGREAVQFLVTVKQCLEDPARMVLHV